MEMNELEKNYNFLIKDLKEVRDKRNLNLILLEELAPNVFNIFALPRSNWKK